MQAALRALLALAALDRLPRTGWLQRGVADAESIAGHLCGTAHVALAVAPRVEPPVDVDRVVALALVHDAPEALLGDIPRSGARLLPAGAKELAERRAAEELLAPLHHEALARYEELERGETREARLARICDKLQLGVRCLAYESAGQGGLAEFRETLEELDCGEFPPAEELRLTLLRAGDRTAPEPEGPDSPRPGLPRPRGTDTTGA